MNPLIVEGPLHDVRQIRDQVVANYGDQVTIGTINEPVDDIFNPGQLGESPIASFLIEYSAELAAGGTISIIAALKNLVQKSRSGKIEIREVQSDEPQGDGDATQDPNP